MRAAQRRWTHTDELLVQLCELVDGQTRAMVALQGGKQAVRKLGKPFKYRRPTEEKSKPIRPRDFIRMMTARGR